ncbi:MAG: DUF2309 domain-containing protein [Verrucomicrobia bacterium]|nr:DUF2309 domain-containing protein [Verrucomicrobiota bacterium]
MRTELRAVCARIAPVWPLESFVAVNPYFGMSDLGFGSVASRLEKVAGARTTLATREYLALIARGEITPDDIQKALHRVGEEGVTAAMFLDRVRALEGLPPFSPRVPTLGETAADVTGSDWARLADDRIATWAGSYFDQGQALWPAAATDAGPYASWKREACIDRTPEVMGLAGVRKAAAALPENPLTAADNALKSLGLGSVERELYLHALLMRLGGWSALASQRQWNAGLAGGEDDTLLELLCIRLAWEHLLFQCVKHPALKERWAERRLTLLRLSLDTLPSESLRDRLLLQDAYDLSEQRRLRAFFPSSCIPSAPDAPARPVTQAVFCIDVRSEIFRRHLEAVAPGMETIGFAGFFGFPIALQPLGHEKAHPQCPVFFQPAHTIHEGLGDPALDSKATRRRRWKGHVQRAWTSFKMGAISCFSFVGPIGLAYLPKLFTDAFGLTRPVSRPDHDGLDKSWVQLLAPQAGGDHGLSVPERVALAKGALTAMSLTGNFAPLVLLVGHGSSTVNNPHAAGLDCGACGGRSGDANARVAVEVLNDPAVRQALQDDGINIPSDTLFLAGRHDTTTDRMDIYNLDRIPSTHMAALETLQRQLGQAGRLARAERARRLGIDADTNTDRAVLARSRDWAQVRPEWGLAGCSAFVAAPRTCTAGMNLDGRSFLHSYDWQQDKDFAVLELILTAPVVVASWISLQYYASTVDNQLFGSGNKTLHNVIGRIGVVEGNGGDLRVGLPWQSLHDGQRLQHPPHRLNVILQAPREAVERILEQHEIVRNLFDNGWCFLHLLDERGALAESYIGSGRWDSVA